MWNVNTGKPTPPACTLRAIERKVSVDDAVEVWRGRTAAFITDCKRRSWSDVMPAIAALP